MTRRDAIRTTLAVSGVPLLAQAAPAGDKPPNGDASPRDYWNDWPAWFTARVQEARAARVRTLASITTEAQARERTEFVAKTAWDLAGGQFEKTPLNPRVTGTITRSAYSIEKVIFESLPEFFVTANLYVPSGASRNPAVLCPLGHASNGKAYRSYQQLFQNLARLGFVVLAFDPIGQGERQYYLDARRVQSRYGPTGEHDQAGRPALLTGSSMVQYRAWDGVRALDYLLTRPEVDPERIGCTGHSGGGTMTMWLAALEPRIKVAVEMEGHSENFASGRYEPPGPYADAEQNVIAGLPAGIDRGDLLWAFAPKPLLLGFTPVDVGTTYSATYELGTREMLDELRQVYKLFGAADKLDLVASTLPHDYDFLLRRAAYNWFTRWLGNSRQAGVEHPFDEGPDDALNCTATGQVVTSIGGRSIVQVNVDRLRSTVPSGPVTQRQAVDGLRRALALPNTRADLRSRVLSRSLVAGFSVEEFSYESEPGVRIAAWFIKPEHASGRIRTNIVAGDPGKDELFFAATQDARTASGQAFCIIDLRGTGISTPRFPSSGPQFFGSDGFETPYGWAALTIGKPVVGQRVYDFLRAIDYVATRADVDSSQIHAAGVGNAGMIALFAAVLDERLRSLVLDRTLADLRSVVESEEYRLPTQYFVPGILRHLDLPDAVAALGNRRCRLVNPTGAAGEALNESAVRARYGAASKADVLVGPQWTWIAALRQS